jgi:hypothetical protein
MRAWVRIMYGDYQLSAISFHQVRWQVRRIIYFNFPILVTGERELLTEKIFNFSCESLALTQKKDVF